MIGKRLKTAKKALCLIFVLLLSINSFAAAVSDNDGSAFITKAEFDSLKSNFLSQINQYYSTLDSKIDEAIASYLAGIKVSTTENRLLLVSDQDEVTSLDLTSDKFKYIYTNPAVDGKVTGWRVPGVGNDVQSFNGNNYYGKNESEISTSNPQKGSKVLIKKLDKTNRVASWAGYSDECIDYLYVRSDETWVNVNVNNGSYANTMRYNFSSSQSYYNLVDAVNKKIPVNANIGRCYYLYGTDGGGSRTLELSSYKFDYGYDELLYQSAFIWEPKEQKDFITYDEELGFGNEDLEELGHGPSGPSFGTTYNVSSDGWKSYGSGTTTNVSSTQINAKSTSTWDSSYNSSYLENKVYPGSRTAKTYITNWDQLYQELWGRSFKSDKSYLKMYEGFPFVKANSDEVISYELKFKDVAEGDTFEIVAKIDPFGKKMDDDKEFLKISKDKTTWTKSLTVKSGDTLYIDFDKQNKLTKKDQNIFLKWRSNSSSDQNGGGTLDLENKYAVVNIVAK